MQHVPLFCCRLQAFGAPHTLPLSLAPHCDGMGECSISEGEGGGWFSLETLHRPLIF
jgi:hypothetical protein